MRHLTLLGATGSIGVSTLDVVSRHPERYRVHALSAHSRMAELAEQAWRHEAPVVVVPHGEARERFVQAWHALGGGRRAPEIRVGAQALVDTAADPASDTVMAAIVGAAGLPAALAAAQAGKRVLLANKEALVAAGSVFMRAVRQHGAELLPIDSEHNAIFQCLPAMAGRVGAGAAPVPGVQRLWLTASGGPFRTWPLAALEHVTPEQACAHPNWSMGRKISVDSATMLNKGLEVIEAHWLFAMPPDAIEVLIHPQSVVHSLVEYADGSVLAQLGQPDMRTPIAHSLAYPERITAGVSPLDLARIGQLDFAAPDLDRFPCLRLAMQALRAGQSACIALNAANEIAVEAFLAGQIGFLQIAGTIQAVLDTALAQRAEPDTLPAVLALDEEARQLARDRIADLTGTRR